MHMSRRLVKHVEEFSKCCPPVVKGQYRIDPEDQEFDAIMTKRTKNTRIAYGVGHAIQSTETVRPDNFSEFELSRVGRLCAEQGHEATCCEESKFGTIIENGQDDQILLPSNLDTSTRFSMSESWDSILDPVVPSERHVYGHPSAGFCGDRNSKKFCQRKTGRKFVDGNP